MNDSTRTRRPGRQSRQSWAVAALTLAALSMGTALGCAGDQETAHDGGLDSRDIEPVPLVLSRVELTSGVRGHSASGTLLALRRAAPGTKVMGQVVAAPVAEGQKVRRGQLLARLESRDLQAEVRQAEAGLAMAEAELVKARANLERTEKLHERGSLTAKNLEDSKAYFLVSQAALGGAGANLEAARVRLGYAEIRSPLDGWLTRKHLQVGDMASPGMPAFAIEDLAILELNAELSEAQLATLKAGDTVRVEVAGRSVETVVSRIVPAGDPRSRTFTLKAEIDNPSRELRSGMFARISWVSESEDSSPRIPRSAIVRHGQLEGVFVAEEATGTDPGGEGQPLVRLRWVKVGAERDGEVEILSGLAGGERVVIEPPGELFDGAPYVEEQGQGASR